MEDNYKNCSLPEHQKIKAIYYCHECKIYMCNKCEKIHSGLCVLHHQYKLDIDISEIFTNFCKEENHSSKLEYFCKTHNQLCCSSCIVKIKKKGNGQHTDCDVCIIEDIKNLKKNKLKENIKILENLSNSFSVNDLNTIFEKINENKEKLKSKIQKIFTKIRNIINEREDELLLKVDEKFDNLFFKGKKIKDIEKLSNNIKIILERGKAIDNENEWDDDNKLSLLINDCINIENNIEYINLINTNLNEINSKNINKIKFDPENEEEINNFVNLIKKFGNIDVNENNFLKSTIKINNLIHYTLSGKNNNIITRTRTNSNIYIGTLIENELDKNIECKWKIKILNSNGKHMYIGIATSDFNINKSTYTNCGWYLYIWNNTLVSGPPHNFKNIPTQLKKINDEITVVMNMKERTLKYIIENEDIIAFNNIPVDKPIFPAIFMYYENDSVEIIKC